MLSETSMRSPQVPGRGGTWMLRFHWLGHVEEESAEGEPEIQH